MKNINKLLQEISDIAQISYKLKNEKGDIYTSPNFYIKTAYIEKKFKVYEENLILRICREDEKALPLLENCIINAIKRENKKKSNVIENIIENKGISKKEVEEAYPFLIDKFTLIMISVNNNIDESISLIQDGYKEENIAIVVYKENILILGKLEDEYEHASSIKETIEYNFRENCIISYCNVNNYENLSRAVDGCIKKISLASKFNVKKEILGETSLVFEDIVDSINKEKKSMLVDQFDSGLSKLDEEMIRTIDVFFNCGLNISESAKLLYIHRNTLIYRIEKVHKYTGFDIKDFNMATVFKILLFLWKEQKIEKM
ncbi:MULTISPECIES: helix-turn-helix domain-containing protein [Clostridium]|uniref:Helix-turn-helix domain-containing protein n=1 Tax=Clostridium cibarium TaxID=2762247 RepID=A0ABR8PUK1_9CLOT|nr:MULTISPECIES: helix-turn-helix domain-containing protein [Clostridium]MBD7911837.1 helix-turn-helix domain-containing protein [Clostridium cibarium]